MYFSTIVEAWVASCFQLIISRLISLFPTVELVLVDSIARNEVLHKRKKYSGGPMGASVRVVDCLMSK